MGEWQRMPRSIPLDAGPPPSWTHKLAPERKANKREPHTEEDMTLIGYAPKGAYLLLRANGNVVVRDQVTFDAMIFPHRKDTRPERDRDEHDEAKHDDHDDRPQRDAESSRADTNAEPASTRRSTRVTAKPALFSETEFDSQALF